LKTVAYAIRYFDFFMNLTKFKVSSCKYNFNLLELVCLNLASKLIDIDPFILEDILDLKDINILKLDKVNINILQALEREVL